MPDHLVDEEQLCEYCALLDLPNLLHYRYGRTKITLKREHAISVQPSSSCPFCRLLASIRCGSNDPRLEGGDRNELEIKIEAPDAGADGHPRAAILWLRSGSGGHRTEGPGFLFSLTRKAPEDEWPKIRRLCAESADLGLVREWMKHCESSDKHSLCQKVYVVARPKMVIDCVSRQVVPASEGEKYLALSYVWGKGSTDEHVFPGLPERLPLTISDAMEATKGLGYRYLWVDRYCINQADAAGKMDEIKRMDLIYQNADATLVAAAGDGPEHGLPGISTRHRTKQHSGRAAGHDIISSMQDSVQVLTESAWSGRAWTYQESLLSRRRICFTDGQVYFECYTGCTSEIVGTDLDSDKMRGSYLRGSLKGGTDHPYAAYLSSTIEEYARRGMTYPGDVINAAMGIMRYFRETASLRHYWGALVFPLRDHSYFETWSQGEEDVLPQGRSLAGALAWHEVDRVRHSQVKSARREGFPSWSWTGWEGELGYSIDFRKDEFTEGLTAQVELRDGQLVDWGAFLDDEALFEDTARHSRYLHLDLLSFKVPLRYYDDGEELPTQEMSRRYDGCVEERTKVVWGTTRCEVAGLYVHFREATLYGYINHDDPPADREVLFRATHYRPVPEKLVAELRQGTAEVFGIVLKFPERIRYTDYDYSVGILAERERQCPVTQKDIVILLWMGENGVAERIGSIAGHSEAWLEGMSAPELRDMKRRRFRVG
jgi:hypothetical protein